MQLTQEGFIACAQFEEGIRHYGEAKTATLALAEFIKSGEFNEFCETKDIEDEAFVIVKVFKAIYADSPEANPEDWEEGWNWILGEEISQHKVQYLVGETPSVQEFLMTESQ